MIKDICGKTELTLHSMGKDRKLFLYDKEQDEGAILATYSQHCTGGYGQGHQSNFVNEIRCIQVRKE